MSDKYEDFFKIDLPPSFFPVKKPPEQETKAKCPTCGIELGEIMGYACPKGAECPVGLGCRGSYWVPSSPTK